MVSLVSATASPASAFTGVLPRFGFVGSGGAPPPRHGKMAGVMASKGGRLAVVVAAAPAAPGPGDSDDDNKGLRFPDCEAALSAFRLEMELFKLKQRPLAFVGSPKDPLLDTASGNAKDCMLMVEFLLAKERVVHRDILKELTLAGQAFLILEGSAKEGYMKADVLADVIQGLKLVGKTFFEGVDLPEYSAPMLPLSSDDVDKESFFKELVSMSVVFYTAVSWEVRKKYKDFGLGGGAN